VKNHCFKNTERFDWAK